ncbi:MAG TPA: phospholipase D-like domain-containing protein, partial [Marmoricola sp.]|nr:phospholipase D-like domain-containing protein [Marmoricola sp.]
KRQFVILRQVNTAIRHAHPGSQIRISSWNVRSPSAVRALIKAHRRGVSVQVIMAKENASRRVPNGLFRKLRKGLRKGNQGRAPGMGSWVIRCHSSCRGTSGISHTKYFLFSATGSATSVVMYGSANLTNLSATNQWNTLRTVFDTRLYHYFANIFAQERTDYPVPAPFLSADLGGLQMNILPLNQGQQNPILSDLSQVICTGAAPGYGNGRGATSIRIAMTATLGKLGISIAQRLHDLQQQGCDIKVVYAVMGNRILATLRAPGPRGGVPIKQVVKDVDHDGVYDYYLHAKVMAISGNLGGNPAASLSVDGSTNWTPVAMVSDETYARAADPDSVARYFRFVDWWFGHAPVSWSYRSARTGSSYNRLAPTDGPGYGARVNGVDPYQKLELS